MNIKIKKIKPVIIMIALLITLVSCTSQTPQMGVEPSPSNADLPETESMVLNFNLYPNKEQQLILNAIEEDVLYKIGEYNVNDSVSSMSLCSLYLQDGKWHKKELLKDRDLEYNDNIYLFLGLPDKSNKVLFSLEVNDKEKDLPGQSFIVGEQPSDKDEMDYYLSSNFIRIEKDKTMPVALKIHGSAEDLQRVRSLMEKNLNDYENDLDFFLKNPDILTDNNIHSYQFIVISFQ